MTKWINDILHYRAARQWHGKRFVYWKKVKAIQRMDPGYFYCPYIPLIRNFVPSLAAPYIPETQIEQDLNHGTEKERTQEEGINPQG